MEPPCWFTSVGHQHGGRKILLTSGARLSKVPKLFGCISGDLNLFVSSKSRRLEARNFAVILIVIPFTTYQKTSFTELAGRSFTNGFSGLSRKGPLDLLWLSKPLIISTDQGNVLTSTFPSFFFSFSYSFLTARELVTLRKLQVFIYFKSEIVDGVSFKKSTQ